MRSEIAKEEANELEIINSTDDNENYKNLLEKIDRSISDTKDKMKKAIKRRDQLQEDLLLLTSKYDESVRNRYSNIKFHCPTCRCDLTPSDAFPLDRSYFEAEVFRYMSECCEQDNDNNCQPENTKGILVIVITSSHQYHNHHYYYDHRNSDSIKLRVTGVR